MLGPIFGKLPHFLQFSAPRTRAGLGTKDVEIARGERRALYAPREGSACLPEGSENCAGLWVLGSGLQQLLLSELWFWGFRLEPVLGFVQEDVGFGSGGLAPKRSGLEVGYGLRSSGSMVLGFRV